MNERTRRNVVWFAIAAGALAVTFVVRAPYAAFAIYAFLLLVVIANLSSLAWLSGLDCTRTISQTVLAQGEDMDIQVTLTNRRGWPIPWIFVEDISPSGFPLAGDNTRLAVLMPGRSITLNYTLTCPRRGYHRIGPLLMESGDLFGLQRRFRTGRQQDYVSVLPTVAYIDTFSVAARRPQGPVRISNRVYEDPTRIASLREYVPGDPFNRIHWKASARTGQLFVKQSEPSNVLGATLVLDLFAPLYQGETGEERTELAITTTASIAYLLQMSGEQVGMLTNARDAAEVAKFDVETRESLSRQQAEYNVVGEDESTRLSPLTVPTRRSPVQALQIVENLARVLPTDGLDIGQTILAHYEKFPRDAALIAVVPQVTEDLSMILAQMKLSGFAVTVFLIRNQASYEKAAGLLLAHNINCIHIEHERQLHEISPARIGR
ncbi:MAG: DUF58 domain-containing protein [Candidatus Hydrogenedentes bacterium]|nr:DUF58 domain-containing protein [Candidatus Hydrogenedentota bacterium]